MSEEGLYPEHPILIVEDEASIQETIGDMLRESGITHVVHCQDPREVFSIIEKKKVEIMILDLGLPHNIRGEDILEKISREMPEVSVIVVTGESNPATVVACMKLGAHDYLAKPITFSRLSTTVRRTLEFTELRKENLELKHRMLRDHLEHPEHFAAILTMDRQLISLFTYIESISRTDLPVLITGEVGVGKSLFAEAVHLSSGLRGEFVRADAAGLGPELLKPLLFGFSEPGAGSKGANAGLVEKAVGGSLYIEEIGETDLDTQGRILHLLHDGKASKRDPTKPRVIASTRHDLKVLMDKGQFRKDLFFRLRPHIIEVPPLRSRKGDIPLLADHFLTMGMEIYGKDRRPVLERSVLDLLKEHEYDGNVRELKDILFAAMGEEKGNRIREDRIRKIISRNLLGQVYAQSGQHDFLLRGAGGFPTFKQAEEILIREAMGRSNNKQTHAAKLLGISRQALNKRLKSKPFNSTE